jgi:hypothetical protein
VFGDRNIKRRRSCRAIDKSSYTGKRKRQAEHVEEGYEDRGLGKHVAERRTWRNRRRQQKRLRPRRPRHHRVLETRRIGGPRGGKASASRPAAARSRSVKKAAATRKRTATKSGARRK